MRTPKRYTKMIYVIRTRDDAKTNLIYVQTRAEAIRICSEVPSLFTWEPLEMST